MLSVEELETQTHDLAKSLDLSNEAASKAVGFASRAYAEHPINRAPSSIAGGAVYAAALLANEKRTQPVVAEAAGTSDVAIRDAYREIIEHEGHGLPERDETPRTAETGRSLFTRARDLLGRGGDA